MTDEPKGSAASREALFAYLEGLATDPEHASLDSGSFSPEELPLARQALELGELIVDERHQAEKLAEGVFDSPNGKNAEKGNPLTAAFGGIRTNLAVPTAIAKAIDDDDYSLEFSPSNEYLAQLKHSVEELRERHNELERNAYTDFLTGVGNRAAFNRDSDAAWEMGTAYTLAFVDIDGLKYCNDHYGHAEGNKYIQEVANCLLLHRRNGERIYRIGGDEFVMLSPSSSEPEMSERLEASRTALRETHTIDESFSYSFSYGCAHAAPASGDSRTKLVNDADKRMYDYKLLHGSQSKKNSDDADETEDTLGIQDRIFQAMSYQADGRYLFVCNIDNDLSRWSRNAVRDFDLPAEVMHKMGEVWSAHIHPDDREAWQKDIDEVFSGKKHHHNLSYRAKDASGRYVLVNCSGVRLEGRGGEPTLFVGTIVNRNAADGTDPATGLDDVRALVAAIDRRKQRNRATDFIVVKVGGIAEINSTYGYEAGNDALSQVSDRLISLVSDSAQVFRSYGLQFILVFDCKGADVLSRRCDDVRGTLEQPIHIRGINVLLPVVAVSAHYEAISSQALPILSDLNRRIDAATRSKAENGTFSNPLAPYRPKRDQHRQRRQPYRLGSQQRVPQPRHQVLAHAPQRTTLHDSHRLGPHAHIQRMVRQAERRCAPGRGGHGAFHAGNHRRWACRPLGARRFFRPHAARQERNPHSV